MFLNANGNGLDTKFRAYVAGFGGGKTFVGCLDLLLFMGMHPSLVQGYFGPTYPSIRDVFYPTFSEAAEMLGFRVAIREANKEVHVYRGRAFYGTVICRSMERAEAIVGFKIARALVDEIDTLKTEKAQAAWNKIIARLRLQVPGVVNGIGVTTTPEGFRFVYRAFADNPKRDYSMVQASTYENAWSLPPDYIPSLLDTYPQELISAYLEGQFVNLTSGTVYRSYNRAANDSTEEIRAGEPLRVGMDFNVGNMAASVFVDREDGWHCVDEIKRGIDTPAMIETLAERYDGHVLTIYPDASGKNASSKGASVSDIGLLRKAGHKIRAKDSNPRVRDRVLAVNKAFERKAIWVNARRCPETAKCLEQQAYDDNGEPDKSSGLDHQNDAFGYPVAFEMPVVKPTFRSSELRI
ncbi:terminase [Brevirhabdus pacifica]|uniref:Terminase n=1 Tax=Brevirhabdus pacifica TaxID=1267768 RepID=A0A1U7DLK5_9RHOB|nr:terminase [Brevirhabdus pacifica]